MTNKRTTGDYTASVEDYLKAIYELERALGSAPTTEIAARLSVSPASVSGMIRRLAEQKLLRHARYRGVRLTKEGRRIALRTLRRHRIIESYLMNTLGYPWDQVHEEAERLEHAASDELIERMAAALGEPTVDPHGAPIPTREGEIDEPEHVALAELSPGGRARIVRVSDIDPVALRRLDEIGATPGTHVTMVSHCPETATFTIRLDDDPGGDDRVIDVETAALLAVEPVS